MRDSVVFYKSFYEAIKRLSNDKTKLEAYEAILEYALYGNVPGGLGEGAGIIFEMAKPQIDANQKRHSDGCLGGAPLGNQNARKQPKQPLVDFQNNHRLNLKQPNENENVNENENENVNEKGKRKKFTPPTKADIEAYCLEANIKIDIDHFLDYYSSNEWKKRNGDKIKDWKLAVRNWQRNDLKYEKERQGVTGSRAKNKFNDFNKHSYNFDELEREAFND